MGKSGPSRMLTTLAMLSLAAVAPTARVDASAAGLGEQVAAKARALAWLSTDATVVAAVKEYNARPPAESRAMTQAKWKSLQVLDPFVRALSKNPLALYLKDRRAPEWTELFVSGADGTKVALFNKTSSWSHQGRAKHDQPMLGKVWIGEVEFDASSGAEQIQIGLPVLDGEQPIGSIVIGFSVARLGAR